MPNPLPGGSPLVKATLTMKSERSVVASFNPGTELRVQDNYEFGAALMQMWFARRLRADEVVVWSARQVLGATVVVSAEGNNRIDLTADSALLGGLGITLDGLSAGVSFGNQTRAAYRVSDPGITFTSYVRAFWLPPDARRQIDGFGFSDDPNSVRSAAADHEPVDLTPDDLLALGDADEPEETELV